MSASLFLEQLANNAHHSIAIHDLVTAQPTEVQKAFLANDVGSMKNQISSTEYYANNVDVVCVQIATE